jgi:hypothetical protein
MATRLLLLCSAMRSTQSDAARAALITTVIAGGLAVDQHIALWGQPLTSICVWLLLLNWLRKSDRKQQIMLTACVVYATLGECFLSLVWGLYDYRLANIPLFVPPGHALLFMLGIIIAARLRDWVIWFVPLAAMPFVLMLAITGIDTFGALLLTMLIVCMIVNRARKLYAVMFVLSLAMEIYGTWMGNWVWAAEVPWLGVTTVNPPLAAGAFYCVLDLLVMSTIRALHAQRLVPVNEHSSFPCVVAEYGNQ